MANRVSITLAREHEDAYAHASSPIQSLFPHMLSQMDRLIEREHEIQGVDIFDIAFAHWLRDAENALSDLTGSICVLVRLPLVHPDDAALQKITYLFHAIMSAETNEQAAKARSRAKMFSGSLTNSYGGRTTCETGRLLMRSRVLLSELMSLDIYSLHPDEHIMLDGPETLAQVMH